MKELKVAMLGMVDDNGHPYSWSAMFNGYDKEAMENCGFPVIPRYLEKEPASSFGVPMATRQRQHFLTKACMLTQMVGIQQNKQYNVN